MELWKLWKSVESVEPKELEDNSIQADVSEMELLKNEAHTLPGTKH